MNRKRRVVLLIIPALLSLSLHCTKTPVEPQDNDDIPVITGDYLGQTPPGATPVVFAPGIISVDGHFEHSGAVFSPDMNEVVWAALPDGGSIFHLYHMKRIDGRWTQPRIMPFTQQYQGNRPVFSQDGQKLYYETIRHPLGGPILVVERQGDGWSEPSAVSPTINATGSERPFSISQENAFYYGRGALADEELLVSRIVNGTFGNPVPFGQNLNSEFTELHIAVAPDETYMIIETTNHTTYADLSISYKKPDGTWTDKIIIAFDWARFPVISPDGNYLFYVGTGGIHWVSTSFVEELRPAD